MSKVLKANTNFGGTVTNDVIFVVNKFIEMGKFDRHTEML